MRKILLPLAALLLGAGCVVQSLYPWLADDTRVDDPALLGLGGEDEWEFFDRLLVDLRHAACNSLSRAPKVRPRRVRRKC